jgi:hypothetical protein
LMGRKAVRAAEVWYRDGDPGPTCAMTFRHPAECGGDERGWFAVPAASAARCREASSGHRPRAVTGAA